MRTFTIFSLVAALCALAAFTVVAQAPQNITINYPAKAPANWPLYSPKKAATTRSTASTRYGVRRSSRRHRDGRQRRSAVMTSYTLEQAMQAASKDGSLVIMGSPMNRGLFAMMTRKDIQSVKDLKGKRFGVSQIGDPPYNYALAILAKNGLDARDVAVGSARHRCQRPRRRAGRRPRRCDHAASAGLFQARIARVQGNRATWPTTRISMRPSAYLFKKSAIAANPKLPELLIKAHAEAIKRYYDDKAMAVKAYAVYDPQTQADVERLYDHDRKSESYERIPYVLAPAVQWIVDHQADAQIGAQLKAYDFHKVIDNSVVERLVREKFFENLFGPAIKAEEDRKGKLAFK